MVRVKGFYRCHLGSQSVDLKIIKRKSMLTGPDISSRALYRRVRGQGQGAREV